MKRFVSITAVFAVIVLAPALAQAQAAIAGQVKDSSGAVLPGATVEASSPALIEKVRTAVTDGTGQYKIENLRPGTYVVTVTLTGFNTMKREGIELMGSFTATVNADLRVGAIEETVTVSGQTPIVDIQSATRQNVVNAEMINSIPTGRTFASLGVLLPGLIGNAQGSQDVGGNQGDIMGSLAAHGGALGDQKIMQNGISIVDLQTGTGGQSGASPNMGATQEVVIDSAAVSAELATGGVRINYIPKDGGNTFRGSIFASATHENLASSNFTQRLKDRGLTVLDSIHKNWDINPGFGGPLVKDKVWFYFTARSKGAQNYAGGMFENANAFIPNRWTYVPDTTKPAYSLYGTWLDEQIRATWQVSPKNKIAATWGNNLACNCPRAVTATLAPEAAWDRSFPVQRTMILEWTSPLTNKLLLEAAAFQKTLRWCDCALSPSGGSLLDPAHQGSINISTAQAAIYPFLVGVTEQAGAIPGLSYHGPGLSRPTAPFTNTWVPNYFTRAVISYITGSHAIKVGYNDSIGYMEWSIYGPSEAVPYRFQFNNGVPNQITEFATPFTLKSDQDHDLGLFAQDRWTIKKLTLTYGLRYDWYKTSYPDQTIGPARLAPNRPSATLPGGPNVNWKDITWRSGFVYDVRGDGKTALKASLNKYLEGLSLGALVETNPLTLLTTMSARSWSDGNRDFVPDCDLTNVNANGECGAMANRSFGTLVPNAVASTEFRNGWNKRSYNWEFSTGVQHEILPRVSVDVSYFRRWYGNFRVTDDLNLAPSNLDTFSIVAPTDPRLPDGGGYTVSGLYDFKPSFFGTPSNVMTTLSDNYGNQIQHWNGIDVSVQSRFAGMVLGGGTSTGRTTLDNCEILTKVPEISRFATSTPFCHIDTPWLTNAKVIASYTIPHIDVQVSEAFQSFPGNVLQANFVVSSAQAALSLGRPLAGGAANATIPLIPNSTLAGTIGTTYGERVNQLDLRVGKIIRMGPRRILVSLDVYNSLNSDTILNTNPNYAAGLGTAGFRPTSILQARFFKIGGQFDF